MRILLAGAAGAIGRRLVPLLVAGGHEVVGTTRRPERVHAIAGLGARGALLDAYDRENVERVMEAVEPDAVIHQLTDLAALDFAGNARVRIEGTRNLVDAALACGVERMVAQSIAWVVAPGTTPATEDEPLAEDATPGVRELEAAVAEVPVGVVLRYGMLYGPGTWFARDGAHADSARKGGLGATAEVTGFVHVDDAAAAAVDALAWSAGVVNVVDDEPARAEEWMPAFAAAVGAPPPAIPAFESPGRPISNARARSLGWVPRHASWREGFATL